MWLRWGRVEIPHLYWFQLFCHKQGCQPPDQAAHSPIQPCLEYLQRWGTHNLSGQAVPVPHHLVGYKEEVFFFFFYNLNLPSLSLKPFPVLASFQAGMSPAQDLSTILSYSLQKKKHEKTEPFLN